MPSLTNDRLHTEAVKAAARGICQANWRAGEEGACKCEGRPLYCSATRIYLDLGIGALIGLEAAGFKLSNEFFGDDIGALEERRT